MTPPRGPLELDERPPRRWTPHVRRDFYRVTSHGVEQYVRLSVLCTFPRVGVWAWLPCAGRGGRWFDDPAE